MNFVANVPYIKCYVKKEYLYDLEKGHGEFEECVLIAVKSMQGRALMFEAYIPAYGACFDKFPLSAFVWRNDITDEDQLPLGQLCLWDALFAQSMSWMPCFLMPNSPRECAVHVRMSV